MGVRVALERELKALAVRDRLLSESALAASALVMAGVLDDPDCPAAARVSAARVLQDALDRLRELAPPVAVGDPVDDIARRRAKRVGAAG